MNEVFIQMVGGVCKERQGDMSLRCTLPISGKGLPLNFLLAYSQKLSGAGDWVTDLLSKLLC